MKYSRPLLRHTFEVILLHPSRILQKGFNSRQIKIQVTILFSTDFLFFKFLRSQYSKIYNGFTNTIFETKIIHNIFISFSKTFPLPRNEIRLDCNNFNFSIYSYSKREKKIGQYYQRFRSCIPIKSIVFCLAQFSSRQYHHRHIIYTYTVIPRTTSTLYDVKLYNIEALSMLYNTIWLYKMLIFKCCMKQWCMIPPLYNTSFQLIYAGIVHLCIVQC